MVAPLDHEALPASFKGQVNLKVAAIDYSDSSLNDSTSVTIIVQARIMTSSKRNMSLLKEELYAFAVFKYLIYF